MCVAWQARGMTGPWTFVCAHWMYVGTWSVHMVIGVPCKTLGEASLSDLVIPFIPCHTLSYLVIPCHTLPYLVIPCRTCGAWPSFCLEWLTISVLACRVVACMPCRVFRCMDNSISIVQAVIPHGHGHGTFHKHGGRRTCAWECAWETSVECGAQGGRSCLE